MSTIEKLGIGLTAQTDLLGKDFERALSLADQFGREMTSRLKKLEVPSPKIEAPKSAGGAEGGQLGDLAATILPLTGQIQSALTKAIAPLNGFAARFGAQFDQVGATIISISKTIDSHLKFPTFQKGIESARGIIAKNFDAMSDSAKKYARVADAALGGVQAVSKVKNFVGSLGGLNAKLGDFGKIKPPTLNFDNSTRSITNLTSITRGATDAFKGLGVQVALALGAFGLVFKAVSFIKDGIANASNLNETISKTDAVLGDASGGVKKFADEMASKFGLVKGEVLDVASGIGGLGKGLGGLSGAGLEKFTTDFAKLAADLSSFKNIGLQEAGKALQVGLSGEQSDQLKQLGVVMTESTVKAFAYANGIAKVGHELTEQEKLMARAGVIQKALADASGDLDKTAGGTANQFRKFTGTITNLGTSIGTSLLPLVDKALGLFNEIGTIGVRAWEESRGAFEAYWKALGTGIDFIIAGFHNWQAVAEVARLAVVQALANIGEQLEVLGPNAVTIAKYIGDNWKELLLDAFNAILAGLQNLWANFKSIGKGIADFLANPAGGFDVQFTPLLDGFESTVKELPELLKPALTDMSRQIADASRPIFDEVNRKAEAAKAKAAGIASSAASKAGSGKSVGKDDTDRQKDLETFAKGLHDKVQSPISKYVEDIAKIDEAARQGLINSADARKGKLKAGEEAGLGGAPKFAGALEKGSSEARSAVLGAINGSGSKTLEEQNRQIAANTKQALGVQRDMLRAFQGMGQAQEIRF